MPTNAPLPGCPAAGRGLLALLAAAFACAARAQPASGDTLALGDVRAGQHGEVWTVFQGTKPEPFSVEVTGVVLNALGPGKSIILCRLTDPRVQNMGAVAGMSGSPLYIDGKFAGALSYQVQQFETVRYAGFTPAADMEEVAGRVGGTAATDSPQAPAQAPAPQSTNTSTVTPPPNATTGMNAGGQPDLLGRVTAALQAAGSTDDPNYWVQKISADPNGAGSAWKDVYKRQLPRRFR